MRVDYLTIFPGMFQGFLENGLIRQGREKNLLQLFVHDLRDYTSDRHRTVDDVSYGGGPGMIFKPEPIFQAFEKIPHEQAVVILPSPQGEVLTQSIAEELAKAGPLIFICGRYEGVDERVTESLVHRELSIGDFVLMGGELPALVMTEAIVRFVPGVVGEKDSVSADSFQDSLLDHPHYTRPEEFRGMKVPEVLMSGHHENIRKWRRKMRLLRTYKRRPDLLEHAILTDEDKKILNEIRKELDEKNERKL